MIDSIAWRKSVIEEINSDENKRRKTESLKRLEIYREMQRKYIIERLTDENGSDVVKRMRTFTSINLAKKIVKELASVYKRRPTRLADDVDAVTAYEATQINLAMKKANKAYKLQSQCALQVVVSPSDKSKVITRVLHPHHYDVVPMSNDPEQAYAYIISSFDKSYASDLVGSNEDISERKYKNFQSYSNSMNDKIADTEDYEGVAGVYYWWTPEYNFKTDKDGFILNEQNEPTNLTVEQFPNPIEMLPFVDIADEKDFEFWVKGGGTISDFQVDYGVLISDITDINRLQGYSQAVIASVEKPQNVIVGPHKVLHLKISPTDDQAQRPDFKFVTPSPDLASSLNLSDKLLYMFLSSLGVDTKTINTSGDSKNYSSGFERLIAAVEKFEASEDDYELFKQVEKQAFEIFKRWNNLLVSTNNLRGGKMIDESIELEVEFTPPSSVMSEVEETDLIIKQLETGLITKLEAIVRLRKVDEAKAKEVLNNLMQAEQQIGESIEADLQEPIS